MWWPVKWDAIRYIPNVNNTVSWFKFSQVETKDGTISLIPITLDWRGTTGCLTWNACLVSSVCVDRFSNVPFLLCRLLISTYGYTGPKVSCKWSRTFVIKKKKSFVIALFCIFNFIFTNNFHCHCSLNGYLRCLMFHVNFTGSGLGGGAEPQSEWVTVERTNRGEEHEVYLSRSEPSVPSQRTCPGQRGVCRHSSNTTG